MAVRLLVAAPCLLHPGGFDVEEHRFVIHGCQVCFAFCRMAMTRTTSHKIDSNYKYIYIYILYIHVYIIYTCNMYIYTHISV